MTLTSTYAVVGDDHAFSLDLPAGPLASRPTNWIRATVGELKTALCERECGAGLTQEQSGRISHIIGERVNFPEMARLALGEHWRQRTPEERQEFVPLFRKLLEVSHLRDLFTHTGMEQRYVAESVIEKDKTVVESLVETGAGNLPINYFLLRHGTAWKIYDLGVDGVRLSHIYWAQYDKVISTSSYGDLVQRLRLTLETAAIKAGRIPGWSRHYASSPPRPGH